MTPGVAFRLDPVEVASLFEVPLTHVLDPANHRLRRRPLGGDTIELYDLPWGTRNIWGATACMLMALYRLLCAGATENR